MLLVILKGACILFAGLLSGSTLYSSLVEIPVRQKLSEDAQVKNWTLVFEKAHLLSKASGLITCTIAFILWYLTSNILWMACSLTLFLILPYTQLLLRKTNNILLNPNANQGLAAHIRTWDRLHHGRTVICFLGFLLCLAAFNT